MIYRIGSKAPRVDARRHLFHTFKADTDDEARHIAARHLRLKGKKGYNYKLYTGDWKEVKLCSGDCNICPDMYCIDNKKGWNNI